MIDLYGIKGAAISTMVSGIISFFIININRPTEIIIILKSISFIRFLTIIKKLILILNNILNLKKNNLKS